MNVIETIDHQLETTLKELFEVSPDLIKKAHLSLNTDKQKQQFGDLSSNAALIISKELGQNPRDIAKKVVDAISHKGELNSKQLEPIFYEHKEVLFQFYSKDPRNLTNKRKEDIIVQTRVAAMGRLSELRIVKWNINKVGISEYTLIQENIGLLG